MFRLLRNEEMSQERKCHMAREKKVGLVSALGAGFEIVKSLVNEILKQGGEEDDVRRLLADERLRKNFAEILIGKTEVVWHGRVEIDHRLSYEDRVKNYGMTFSQVLELYPITPRAGTEKVGLVLVRFGRAKSVLEMEKELCDFALANKETWRMAGAEEAIAFGDQHRELVCKFDHITALGDSKFSEQKAPVSDQHIPFCGKIGSKLYFEVLGLSWPVCGGLTLSTHQFFNGTWPGCCILCSVA
jgi:hypothetical protein